MADWWTLCSSPSAPPSHEKRRAGRAGINPATLSRLCIYPGPRLGERLQQPSGRVSGSRNRLVLFRTPVAERRPILVEMTEASPREQPTLLLGAFLRPARFRVFGD